jgi:hypothetical protein
MDICNFFFILSGVRELIFLNIPMTGGPGWAPDFRIEWNESASPNRVAPWRHTESIAKRRSPNLPDALSLNAIDARLWFKCPLVPLKNVGMPLKRKRKAGVTDEARIY